MSSVDSQAQPIDKQLLDACIHCGLCLPACPTYLATGREMESPRGRIYLLNQWNSGEQELTPQLVQHIESCLGCLGCQTACPSGVQYGSILNAARPSIASKRPASQRKMMRFSFQYILPNYGVLHLGGKLLRLWQQSGLGRALAWLAAPTAAHRLAGEEGELLNPVRRFLYRLHVWESFMPAVPGFEALPLRKAASGDGVPVQLFIGCVMDIFYNHVNRACARLLSGQGRTVEVPKQGCCGALAMHAGESDIARELARKNIEYFEGTIGPIVVTAAGCGAMLKEYPELFYNEPDWLARAHAFAQRVVDITEALAAGDLPRAPGGDFSQRFGEHAKVAYHAACHLFHAQNVRQAPEALLRTAQEVVGVGALELIPLREFEHCCGSAGIYNLLNTELSMKVLARKMFYIERTGANVVVSTNPGCLLQLEAGVRKNGLEITVVHLVELLDQIYGVGRP